MLQANLKLVGISPLLMHSQVTLDRFDPLTRKIASINAKRKKTDDDHLELRRLEWEAGLYFDEEMGPYIPGTNFKSALVEGGKLDRLGQNVKRGIQIPELMIKLEYNGPRKVEEMYGTDGKSRFVDCRSVAVQRARVMRTRPVFRNWSINVMVAYDESMWDEDVLRNVVEKTGQYVGLLDYRPEHGRFKISKTDDSDDSDDSDNSDNSDNSDD